MIEVSSSMIRAVDYDAKAKILYVLFRSGDLYEYYEVEPSIFQELLNAPSKGSYMRKHIVDCYKYAKKSS